MQTFSKFCFEKKVLGIVEDITIPELGTVSAKLDTGNGGYNVLHATDISIDPNSDIVHFNTINNTNLEKTLDDKVKINVGSGNVEERPVVVFDVKVGKETYKKVPFSLADRSTNEKKVLISKSFIHSDLDALIDVSKVNNASENEDVDIK